MSICKVIAEVGSTWKRETPALSKLAAQDSINQAAQFGADAVKFQLFTADGLYSRERAPKQWKAIKGYELDPEWIPDLRIAADEAGVELWFSVFDRPQRRQVNLQADAIKVASGELGEGSRPLLGEAKSLAERLFVPFVFSTGTHTEDEVAQAIKYAEGAAIPEIVLMNCVSKYPAQVADYDLFWPLKYRHRVSLGLSDHTVNTALVSPAVLYGYRYFEKHFRLDDTPPNNPDYGHSLTPGLFRNYVTVVRSSEQDYLGVVKKLAKGEEDERRWMQRGSDGKRPNF